MATGAGRIVADMDMGEARPELSEAKKSGEIGVCASSKPVALALDEPTAGAAFCDSTPPVICIRLNGRKEVEFAVETTDSVGLLGRSRGFPRSAGDRGAEPTLANGEVGFFGPPPVPGEPTLSDDADALIVASLLLRSSKGALSILETR